MNRKLFALILLLALAVSACAPAATPTMAPPAPASAPSKGPDSAGNSYSGTVAGLTVAQDAKAEYDPSIMERMVIKNASLIIVVDSPALAMTTISEMAAKMGGFVVSSDTYQTGSQSGAEVPEVRISIRVPSEKLDDALVQIRALVKNQAEDIRKENITGQDVTKDYTDLQSRLINLESTEKQLQKIQESATKTEDVLSVFRELSNVRQQIEVIKGQMKYYADSASTSAIDIQILAAAGIAPISVGGWQPLGVAADALNILLNLGKFLVNFLIYVIIIFGPLGLVFYIPFRWIRRLMRRSKTSPLAAVAPSKSDFPELK